jgi:plasmid stabilization system protein ParE
MKIVWSNEAKLTYEAIIDDLLRKWAVEIALNFENDTNAVLDRLKINKKLCPPSKVKKLRKCVVHKNVSLIYRIKASTIELITFIDNRTDHNY